MFVLKAALENSDRDQQPFHPMPGEQFTNVIPAPKRAATLRQHSKVEIKIRRQIKMLREKLQAAIQESHKLHLQAAFVIDVKVPQCDNQLEYCEQRRWHINSAARKSNTRGWKRYGF